jgi:hypothetical protein
MVRCLRGGGGWIVHTDRGRISGAIVCGARSDAHRGAHDRSLPPLANDASFYLL